MKTDLKMVIVVVLAICLTGCTHVQLRKSNNHQVSSLTELLYGQTLSNVAMIHCTPGALPHVAIIGAGATQVTDGKGAALGLSWNDTSILGETLSFNASRNIGQSWSILPITDPDRLLRLQCALRFMTQGYSLSITEVTKQTDDTPLPQLRFRISHCQENACENGLNELLRVGFLTRPKAEQVDEGTLDFQLLEDAQTYLGKLLQEMQCKLPTCWYGIALKGKAPKTACHQATYKGCCGAYVIWVDVAGIDALSRATRSLQELAVLEPSSSFVTIRRLIKTTEGELEIIGTTRGSIGAMQDYADILEKEQQLVELKEKNQQELNSIKSQGMSEQEQFQKEADLNKKNDQIQENIDRLREQRNALYELNSQGASKITPQFSSPGLINPIAIPTTGGAPSATVLPQ